MGRRWNVLGGIALWSLASMSTAMAQPAFEATDGFVVMEAESGTTAMFWETETPTDAAADKARGDVRYFNDPEASICSTGKNTAEGFPTMDYTFRVEQAGVYWVKMNMRKQVHCVTEGTDGASCHSGAGCTSLGIQSEGDACDDPGTCWRSDISNDAYVSMETADGEGVPYIGGDTSIMKLFGGHPDEYRWSGNSALDHNPPTYQLEPGAYVFRVRGRSRGLKLDRIIIFHEDADEAAAKSADESPWVDPDPPPGSGGGATTGAGGATTSGGAGATTGVGSGTGGATATPPPLAAGGSEADGGCAMNRGSSPSPVGPTALLLGLAACAARRRRA